MSSAVVHSPRGHGTGAGGGAGPLSANDAPAGPTKDMGNNNNNNAAGVGSTAGTIATTGGGGGLSHAANVARDAEDYNRILNTMGKPNYTTIRDLFLKDGGAMPSDTVPAIQISFELFETVQNRFANTKQTLERTKAELHKRNQEHAEVVLQLRQLREEYKLTEKRAEEAEESNRELRRHAAKLDGTIEQLRMEAAQMRTEMEAVQEKLIIQEDRLHDAQNRVAEALVTISQKEAGITALRRELGKYLRYRQNTNSGEDPEDVLRNIAADVEGRAKEVRTKLGVAQLQEALHKVEQENVYILQQHQKYVQHVQQMIAAYETQAMSLEDGFASHKCVDTPYYLSSEFYDEYLHPERYGKKREEEESLRTLAEPPTEDPGQGAEHKTFRGLTFEFQRSLDRMGKIDIDPASKLKDEIYTCIQSHTRTMNLGAQLVSFLSTWEAELTHTRLSMPELREEWIKAKVPMFVSKTAAGLQESVTAFSTGLFHLLERENDLTALLREAEEKQLNGGGFPLNSSASSHTMDGSDPTGGGGPRRSGSVSSKPKLDAGNLDSPNKRRTSAASGGSNGSQKTSPKRRRGTGASSSSSGPGGIGIGTDGHEMFDRSVDRISSIEGEEMWTQTSRNAFSPDTMDGTVTGTDFSGTGTMTATGGGPPGGRSRTGTGVGFGHICAMCRRAMRPDSAEILEVTDQFQHTLNPEIAEEIRQIVTQEEVGAGGSVSGSVKRGSSVSGGARSHGGSTYGADDDVDDNREENDKDSRNASATDEGGSGSRRRSSSWRKGSESSSASRQRADGREEDQYEDEEYEPLFDSDGGLTRNSLGGGRRSRSNETGGGPGAPSVEGAGTSRSHVTVVSPHPSNASNISQSSSYADATHHHMGTSPVTIENGIIRMGGTSEVLDEIVGTPTSPLNSPTTQKNDGGSSSGGSTTSIPGRTSYLAKPEVRALIDKYETGMRIKERELEQFRVVAEQIGQTISTKKAAQGTGAALAQSVAELLRQLIQVSARMQDHELPTPLPRVTVNKDGYLADAETSSSTSSSTATKKKKKPRMTQETVDRLYNNTGTNSSRRRMPKTLPPINGGVYAFDDRQMGGSPMGIGGMKLGLPPGAKAGQPTFTSGYQQLSDEELQQQHAALIRAARLHQLQGGNQRTGPMAQGMGGTLPPGGSTQPSSGTHHRVINPSGGPTGGEGSEFTGALYVPNPDGSGMMLVNHLGAPVNHPFHTGGGGGGGSGRENSSVLSSSRRVSGAGELGSGMIGGSEWLSAGYRHDSRAAEWLPKGSGFGFRGSNETSLVLDEHGGWTSAGGSRRTLSLGGNQTEVNRVMIGGMPSNGSDQPQQQLVEGSDGSHWLQIGGKYVRVDHRSSWIQQMLQQQQFRRLSLMQQQQQREQHQQKNQPLAYNILGINSVGLGGGGGGLAIGGYNPLRTGYNQASRGLPPAYGDLRGRRWSGPRGKALNSGLRRTSYLTQHKVLQQAGIYRQRSSDHGNNPFADFFQMPNGTGLRIQNPVMDPLYYPRRNSALKARRDPYVSNTKRYSTLRYMPVRSNSNGGLAPSLGVFNNNHQQQQQNRTVTTNSRPIGMLSAVTLGVGGKNTTTSNRNTTGGTNSMSLQGSRPRASPTTTSKLKPQPPSQPLTSSGLSGQRFTRK